MIMPVKGVLSRPTNKTASSKKKSVTGRKPGRPRKPKKVTYKPKTPRISISTKDFGRLK